MFNTKYEIKALDAKVQNLSAEITLLLDKCRGLEQGLVTLAKMVPLPHDVPMGLCVKEGTTRVPNYRAGFDYPIYEDRKVYNVIDRQFGYSYGSPFTEKLIKSFHTAKDAEIFLEGYKLTSSVSGV